MSKNAQIVIFRAKDGRDRVEVRLEGETLWLDAHQIARIFERDRSVVLRHIHNIYATQELSIAATCAKNAQVAADGKVRQMDLYNLDVIIAVGYRVNSKRGTQFRIWATQVLRDHLLKGYTVNEQRLRDQVAHLKELQATVDLLGRVMQERRLTGSEAEGLLKVVTDYSLALSLLDQYDHQQLAIRDTTTPTPFVLTYDAAKAAIVRMGEQTGMRGGLFGREKDDSFRGSIGAIYQTFGGRELYPSIEEKAAHLLYFVVKNHSFVDGNKRIAAFLFVWFLDANRILYRADGTKRLGPFVGLVVAVHVAEKETAGGLVNDDADVDHDARGHAAEAQEGVLVTGEELLLPLQQRELQVVVRASARYAWNWRRAWSRSLFRTPAESASKAPPCCMSRTL